MGKPRTSTLSVTDQFCGAGGSSQGARRLQMDVQLAMNHWQLAIRTHNENFPDTHHDCADVSTTDPRRYWATDILITSPECTNHSVGKGQKRRRGQLSLFGEKVDPAAERSRATMWDVPRFAEFHNYNMIIVENVVDARDWRLFDDWLRTMHTLGYDHHIVYMNSMFGHMQPLDDPQYGRFAPQSRDRMYCIFWKRGNKAPDLEFRPQAWCPQCERTVEAIQSWKNTPATRKFGGRWGRYQDQYIYACPNCSVPRKVVEAYPYYYAAANAIDWSLPVERIGDRDKPLKDKTLTRIRKGLEMFAGEHLLLDLARAHGHDRRSVPLLRASMPTQTTAQTGALLMLPFMIETLYKGDRLPRPVTEQMATQTARQSTGVVIPPFMTSVNYYADNTRPVDEPMPTQTTGEKMGVVYPPFLMSLNHSTDRYYPTDGTLPTQMPHARNSLVVPPFLLGYANSESPARGVDEAMRTVHTENGQALVIPPFMVQFHNNQDARSLDEAMSTISTSGSHHGLLVPAFLMSYYGDNANHRPVDREMGTVTTGDRHALVQPGGEVQVEDCGFRMLQPHEIQRGMAFDDDYIVLGTKRQQVKQLGNAVTPPVMERLLERCAATFN